MTKKFCITAAVFALLTAATPARAAYIYEDINVNLANGFQVTGPLTFLDITDSSGNVVAAYLQPCCSGGTLSGGGKPWFLYSTASFGPSLTFASLLPYVPPMLPPGASPGHPGIGPQGPEVTERPAGTHKGTHAEGPKLSIQGKTMSCNSRRSAR
jgi:hypothetical protein